MKQLIRNVWRFVNKYPWIGGMPLACVLLTAIVFCGYGWTHWGLNGIPDDMVALVESVFRWLVVPLKVSIGVILVMALMFLVVRRIDEIERLMVGVGASLLLLVPSVPIVGPFVLLVYERTHPAITKPWTVQCTNINDPVLGCHREKVAALLPHGATDIYVSCDPGCFGMGASEFFRCKVSPDDLRLYIKEQGYNFRFDSTQVNENSKYPSGGLGWPNEDGTSLSGGRLFMGLGDVDEYWSYNYINANNGGYRMFYDLKRQLFYYSWSAN